MTSFLKSKTILAILLVALIFVFCSKDETIPSRFVQPLTVEIIAGPENNGTVMNNAHFSFVWSVLGGEGDITFTYQLTGVDATAASTNDFSHTYPGQPEGSYTFTITATDASGASDNDTRAFTVGGSLSDPAVVISGPRGSLSSGGSGVTPEYAPGATINLTWTGSDEDRFGNITGYRYKPTSGGTFTEWALGTTVGFIAPTAEGSYGFVLEAKDNTGTTVSVTLPYVIKAPEILIVDDLTFSAVLNEIACDNFYEKIFDGYAYEVVDVDAGELPAAVSSATEVIVWYGASSDTWTNIGASYPEASNILSDFIDGGGSFWAMGWGILEAIRFNPGPDHSNPPAAEEFEAKYFHISTTEAWTRAGGTGESSAFSFAIDELGQPGKFPKLKIGVRETGGDVDAFEAEGGAEIVYSGLDGLDNPVGNVALRYPSGGTNTTVFFMTFPLFVSSANKISPITAAILVGEIMTEMGQ